jgi:hypothetical protein
MDFTIQIPILVTMVEAILNSFVIN